MAVNKGHRNPGANNDRRVKTIAIVVVAAVLLSAAGYLWSTRGGNTGKEITTASGLKYVDVVEGTGPTPRKGQKVSVMYTG